MKTFQINFIFTQFNSGFVVQAYQSDALLEEGYCKTHEISEFCGSICRGEIVRQKEIANAEGGESISNE